MSIPVRKCRAHRSGLAVVDAQVVTQRLMDTPGPTQHAGRGAADHHVVLADLAAVEHGVEGGHLCMPRHKKAAEAQAGSDQPSTMPSNCALEPSHP